MLARSTVAGEGSSCLVTGTTGTINPGDRSKSPAVKSSTSRGPNHADAIRGGTRACRSVHSEAVPNRSDVTAEG